MKPNRAKLPAVLAPCGIEHCTGRFTWVCVKPTHASEKQRSLQYDNRGYAPRDERHHFVRKYPGTNH